MNCIICNENCIRWRKQNNGEQRYYCKCCKKHQQENYKYNAYNSETDKEISLHTKEGCGIRSTARLLHISPTTVIKRIRKISACVVKPSYILKGNKYETDELRTYVRNKTSRYCSLCYKKRH